jgi:hypothetical protein
MKATTLHQQIGLFRNTQQVILCLFVFNRNVLYETIQLPLLQES